MASDNDNKLDNIISDDFSLESILAEYKGSAYINGDKKTPPELLKEQAERILMEAAGKTEPEPLFPADDLEIAEIKEIPEIKADPQPDEPTIKIEPIKELKSTDEPAPKSFDRADRADRAEKADRADRADRTEKDDKVILFLDNYQSQPKQSQDSIVRDVEKAIERELGYVEEKSNPETSFFGSSGRSNAGVEESFVEEQIFETEEEFEEPDLGDAVRRFAELCNSISLRCIPAALIALFMVILTFAFEAGMIIPFNIGRSQSAVAGTLVISMLAVMMLCVDLIVRGAENLVRGALNVETLILFSCVFSFISGIFTIINDESGILPYCAVSALSLAFAAFGEKYNLRAITETLKTASVSSEPYGVQAEYNGDINKSVLKKAFNRTDGFYNNLMHPDITETMYRYAAPVLLAGALVLAIISAIARGQGQYFLHILSALLAAAAPFSALLAYALPFNTVARAIRKSGAAIAGWGGADDICFTDGACLTDEDLFPPGTLKFNGLKLYDSVSPEKAIRYTASLIAASGSGLSRIFSEALAAQGMKMIKVEDFTCHEGGIGALIRGEQVMTGSAAFMNLRGIRPPDEVNMNNAVFTAVNDKLIAMFAINYEPLKSVQNALISILKWRIKIIFAVRDFNVTPSTLLYKFRVSLEDIEYIQAKDSYNISDSNSGKEGRMAAVLIRDGLSPFAEAVTGGKLLKTSALVAAVISVISAAVGVLFMFFMCWTGAFMSAKPGNLILFMLSMLAAVLIVCGYARLRK